MSNQKVVDNQARNIINVTILYKQKCIKSTNHNEAIKTLYQEQKQKTGKVNFIGKKKHFEHEEKTHT